VRPHRPEDYLETVIPHVYNPGAKPVLWPKVLGRWFLGESDSPAKHDALQEYFGYCLLPHARYKKALFLHGDTDTGKSVIPLTLKQLVGFSNYCTISTEDMADARKREDIVGKMVNLLTELPMEAMIADSGFKQLVSTGDPIAIDPKFCRRFSYVPFCKHVICCNTLPTIGDLTSATWERILLVEFNLRLPKPEQDKELQDKLAEESQGILAWSIEGADRLIRNNGEFTTIEESVKRLQEYRDDENTVVEFLRAHTGEEEESNINMHQFREEFRRWSGQRYGVKQITRMTRSAGGRVETIDRERLLRGRYWVNWDVR
jgi:putative DNA primase/helicase